MRNAILTTSGGGVIKVLNFLYSIYVIRVLGEIGFGQYHSVVAFVGLFGVFLELGMSQYTGRTIAQDPSRTQSLFWNLMTLRLMLAVPGSIIITVLAGFYGFDSSMVFAVILYTGTFLFAALLVPIATVAAANERFDIVTVSQVTNQLIAMLIGAMLLGLGVGFYSLIYTSFVAMPVQIFLCLWAIRRYRLGPPKFHLTPHEWPAILRASMPFGLISLALTFNFNVDTVILRYFHGDGMAGWYNAAYRLVFNLVGLVGGYMTVITPSLAREHVGNPERVQAWARNSVQWLALFALPVTMGISVMAQSFTDLLFGPAFGPSGPVLAIIAWDVPLLLFTALCGNITAAVGLEHPSARIYLLAAVANLILNLALIPAFGLQAAAVVTVLTDGLAAALFFHLLSRSMQIHQITPILTRTALAALLMGVVVWLARSLAMPLEIAIGVMIYAILVLFFRLIDLTVLRSTIKRIYRRSIEAAS